VFFLAAAAAIGLFRMKRTNSRTPKKSRDIERDFKRLSLELMEGCSCLDFCNTVSHRSSPIERKEWIRSFSDLIFWARKAHLLTPLECRQLVCKGAARPMAAKAALGRALRAREILYSILSARTNRREPLPSQLASLQRALSRTGRHLQLLAHKRQYRWAWTARTDLDSVLWMVVWSAANLLVSPDLRFVRECAGSPCGWLFLDKSRNHARRWCSMQYCGNRAKSRSYYQRSNKKARRNF
jgi:predicted RNA-binding Zn ribbon-like protein